MTPWLALAALALKTPTLAGDATVDLAVADIEDVSLEELLSEDVAVSSSTAATVRASPGVVSVWTRDEIRALGVRDLGELLPFIAGFDLGIDTVGLVGAAFRGVWGFEGKVLFLVDGLELNDTSFGSMPLFARLPLEDVERIEVLRGPGSARYGGFAGLAVVSITTRAHTPADRFTLETTMGVTSTDAPPRNGTAAIAGGVTLPSLRRLVGDVDAAGFAEVTTRTQSGRDYTSPSGTVLDQSLRSDALSLWLQGTLRAPHLEGRLLLQNWQQQNQTGYDATTFASPGATQFLTGVADLRFPITLSPTLSLQPRLSWSRFLPWRSPVNDPAFRVVNDRLRVGATTQWQPFRGLQLAGGLELTGDVGRHMRGTDVDADAIAVGWDALRADDPDVAFANVAVFGEAAVDTPLFLLTVGARGERHSAYGDSFVPRVALTRVFPGAHAKLLVAGAFRAPALDNLRVTPALTPEQTASLGLEAGVAISPSLYLTVNAFDLTTRDPIVYFVDESGADEDGYRNFGTTGSRGVEATLLGATSFGRLQASWSYASAVGKNDVDVYAVPGVDDRLLGLPSHKLVAIGSVFVARGVTLTGDAVLRSERAAVVALDAAGAPVIDDLPASVMLGGALRLALADSGLALLIGVRNLLGDDYRLVQPYASGHGPLPVDDPEVFLRLSGALDDAD